MRDTRHPPWQPERPLAWGNSGDHDPNPGELVVPGSLVVAQEVPAEIRNLALCCAPLISPQTNRFPLIANVPKYAHTLTITKLRYANHFFFILWSGIPPSQKPKK